MTGLLIKDLKLMTTQKSALFMTGGIAIILVISTENFSFVITYLTIIGVMYTMNTLSHDSFDNGNAYLFSLPITRKGYVAEKYVFGFLGGTLGLTGAALCFAVNAVKGSVSFEEILVNAFVALPLMMFLLGFLLPIEIKFGAEKARIMIMIVTCLFFVTGLAVVKAGNALHIDLASWFKQIENRLELAAAVSLAAGVIILGISCIISVRIINKKEF